MVFGGAVPGDRVLPHAGDLRLDQGPLFIDDERGMTPVGENRVRALVPAPLRQADEPGYRVMAVRQDEVARDQVIRLLTWAVSLTFHHVRVTLFKALGRSGSMPRARATRCASS